MPSDAGEKKRVQNDAAPCDGARVVGISWRRRVWCAKPGLRESKHCAPDEENSWLMVRLGYRLNCEVRLANGMRLCVERRTMRETTFLTGRRPNTATSNAHPSSILDTLIRTIDRT